MSLRDATKKMSKSDINDYSRINITDDVSIIFDKIKKSKTDSLGRVKLIFIYIYINII
jgi:tryptophanyl-tRNA synthetase